MLVSPKKTKYKKFHRGRLSGKALSGNKVHFGDYGLQALEPSWISSKQIESTRRTINKYTKRNGKVWIRIFPDKSVTARAPESRMGSGKGSVEYWVAVVKSGTILFELKGVSIELARFTFKQAGYKLPIKTKFILKE
jgi:large subunit ribosomal protein L16